MKVLLPIERTAGEERALVGGKALALARLGTAGFNIPQALCVTTEAYSRFVESGGLRGAIARELGRKRFEDMRWEMDSRLGKPSSDGLLPWTVAGTGMLGVNAFDLEKPRLLYGWEGGGSGAQLVGETDGHQCWLRLTMFLPS